MTFRRGVRIGVDVGTVRVGVAKCDADGILATPLATLRRDSRTLSDLHAVGELVSEWEALEVVVGLPVTLSGELGPAAVAAQEYARALAKVVKVPVRMVDERLSTAAAQRNLHAAGRDTRRSRSVIDQAAAALIVQSAIDAEKAAGAPPGKVVTAE